MPKPKKSDVDAQKYWDNQISRAKSVRKKWKELFKVDMLKEFFDGKQNPGWPEEDWITVNKVYSHLKAQLPALYNADPYFYVKVKKSYSPNPMDIAMFEQKGKIRQAYLNYLKEEIGLKEKARLCIQDAHFSYGVAKVYYKAELKENPDAGQNMTGEDGLALIDDAGQPIPEPETIPINQRYCVSRIHPDDFIWDEDAGPLPENWRWVAQCVRMTRAEAEEDKRFSKAALKKLKSSADESSDEERKARNDRKKGGDITGRSERERAPGEEKEEAEIVYTWEIYDLKKSRFTVIAENGEIPLINAQELPPGIEHHPFSILRFTLRDDSPYPIPPLSPMMDPQKEYNLARSRILKHRKRFNRKYHVIGQFEDGELSKLESGDDGTVVKGQQGSDIKPIDDAPLDQMGYAELTLLNNDMIELGGGAGQEARGIAGAESATQAGIIDKRLEMKEGDAMSMVVDFATTISKKLDQQVKAHITEDEAVRITGPQGENWNLVKATDYQDIAGEFEYSVNTGATIPQLPQMERSQWMAFLQVVQGFPALLTAPHFMKRMGEMFHLEDEAMIEELRQIGLKILQGKIAPPKPAGSQPGVSETKPASVTGGQAGGPKSLALPLTGNAPNARGIG